MATQPSPPALRSWVKTATVLVFSVLVLAAAILVTSTFGLEVRTSYGAGVDTRLGGQVVRDFLADQDAEAAALSSSDQALLNNRLSDSALADVVQQIQSQSGAPPPTVSFEPSSLTVLRAQDPGDPSLLIEVQEEGTKTVITSHGANAAPTQDQVGFRGNYWLRLNGGRYTIADQDIQTLPTSYLPQLALVAVALLWVGLANALYRRTRGAPATRAKPDVAPLPAATEAPVAFDAVHAPEPSARTVISTFRGLKVAEAGKDWAPELSGRQVMAFGWRRILLASFENPAAGVGREVLARQLNPLLEREVRFERLRKMVNQGLKDLPEPLRRRIIVEPRVLRFDLEDCVVDALELLRARDEFHGLKVLSLAQAARARRLIEATNGTFLPEFESVEDLTTNSHPTNSELIQKIRVQLADARRQLLATVARTYVAGHRPEMAVELLESASPGLPANTDISAALAEAYRAAGREQEARALAGG